MAKACKQVLTRVAIEKRIFRRRRMQARVARIVSGFGIMISLIVLSTTIRNARSDDKKISQRTIVGNTIFGVSLLAISTTAFFRWPRRLVNAVAINNEVIRQIYLYNEVIDKKFPGYNLNNLCTAATKKTEDGVKLKSDINKWISENYRCKQASIIANDAADRYDNYLDKFDDDGRYKKSKKKEGINQVYLLQLYFDRNVARLEANNQCSSPLLFPDVQMLYDRVMAN